jgi:6-phosphofructokinase 1
MNTLKPEQIKQVCDLKFEVERLGEATLVSPLVEAGGVRFVDDGDRVSFFANTTNFDTVKANGWRLPSFVQAGPRPQIFHDPSWTRAAIVTCGGLCPGLNDVIKALVNTLYYNYGVDNIFGIQYGYRGLIPGFKHDPVILNPDVVDTIHEKGGTMLGSSRGYQEPEEIVRFLDRQNINVLFTIGGDGTQRGTRDIVEIIRKKRLSINVIGIPKTIDNDLNFTDRTFGFETAVQAAAPVIRCAHEEATGAYNGIGLVKLMGRDSGFIAAHACLANSVVNFCLIPEVTFELEGENGLLESMERRLQAKQHAVIVVAEGAGQDLMTKTEVRKDASGNILHDDIGLFLKQRLLDHFKAKKIECSLKYFDPSYMIRSVVANSTDAIFCLHLAQNAVHAAMAGMTNVIIGYWHGQFTYVPVELAVMQRRKVDPNGQLWQGVMQTTRQGEYLKMGPAIDLDQCIGGNY